MACAPDHAYPLTRRELIRRGALGLTLAGLWRSPSWAEAPHTITRVLLRYRTSAERIARALPPPLEPDDLAEVWVEYVLATLPETISPTLVTPPSFSWSAILVPARHGDERGLFPAGIWTSDEWSRINAREFLGLNVKPGEISLEVSGETIRAGVRRHDQVLHRFETAIAKGAPEVLSQSPANRDLFTYLYHPNPNWTEGPLTAEPVRLARISGQSLPEPGGESQSGAPGVVPCAAGETVFEWVRATPSDPAIEFPVEEILAAEFEKNAAAGSLLVDPRGQSAPLPQAEVSAEEFEPFALVNYDRPVTNEDPWRPKGWRESATAYSLSEEELTAYRARKELLLGSVNIVDIQLVSEREAFVEALPPQFQPGLRLRLLALRVGENDLTQGPFNEAWLFAYALIENRPLWFALSHIAGAGGELTFGRETFGYPSKSGEVDVVTTPIDFSVLGRRKGRDFFYTEGTFQGFSTGTSLAQMDLACLRAGPFRADDPSGEIIAQQWYFQGRRSFVDRSSLVIEFPEGDGANGRSDPWFEFNPFRVVSVTVMQNGRMQRMPGEIIAGASGIAPYYRERCDGVLPGKDPTSDFAPPGFRVDSSATTRSALRSIFG